jgi:hypothetical protein
MAASVENVQSLHHRRTPKEQVIWHGIGHKILMERTAGDCHERIFLLVFPTYTSVFSPTLKLLCVYRFQYINDIL